MPDSKAHFCHRLLPVLIGSLRYFICPMAFVALITIFSSVGCKSRPFGSEREPAAQVNSLRSSARPGQILWSEPWSEDPTRRCAYIADSSKREVKTLSLAPYYNATLQSGANRAVVEQVMLTLSSSPEGQSSGREAYDREILRRGYRLAQHSSPLDVELVFADEELFGQAIRVIGNAGDTGFDGRCPQKTWAEVDGGPISEQLLTEPTPVMSRVVIKKLLELIAAQKKAAPHSTGDAEESLLSETRSTWINLGPGEVRDLGSISARWFDGTNLKGYIEELASNVGVHVTTELYLKRFGRTVEYLVWGRPRDVDRFKRLLESAFDPS